MAADSDRLLHGVCWGRLYRGSDDRPQDLVRELDMVNQKKSNAKRRGGLVTVEFVETETYRDLLGDACATEEAAEHNSKRHLIRGQLRRINMTLRAEQRELTASAVVRLEEIGSVSIDWKKLMAEEK